MNSTEHHAPLKYLTLLAVLAVLLALTAVTIGVSRLDLGILNIWIALLIASVKATLVILFFMHLKYEPPLMKYTFVGAVGCLAIFIGFLFWDIAFR